MPTELPARSDVVVVGGGAIGTSIAFHLAEAGVDVTLLERDALSAGSTSRAAGGIRAQFSDPLNIAIGMRSIEAFTRFADRPGGEIDFRQVGYLFLLDRADDVAVFEESVRLQNELGVPSRVVDAAEAGALSPLAGWTASSRRPSAPSTGMRARRRSPRGTRRRHGRTARAW